MVTIRSKIKEFIDNEKEISRQIPSKIDNMPMMDLEMTTG